MVTASKPSEEGVEHASLEVFGSGPVPDRELDDPAQVGAAPQAGEGGPAGGPLAAVEAPEGRRASLGHLDADGVLTRRPLTHAHRDDGGGGEDAGVRGDAVVNRLPRPHRRRPLPRHAGLLRHAHPAQVAQGQETHLLQGPLVREPEQDGDEPGNCTSAEQKLLQLRWRETQDGCLECETSEIYWGLTF